MIQINIEKPKHCSACPISKKFFEDGWWCPITDGTCNDDETPDCPMIEVQDK